MAFSIALPEDVGFILERLRRHGFDAHIVGGCVRDALLGKTPADWDVTTSALPEQISRVFQDYPQIEIGKQHGTIAVILHHQPFEITTYRTEGKYLDHRHPTSVTFTTSLKQDLSRRDFTINALAYAPDTGLVDCFGGIDDLRQKLVRTVGDPRQRFEEDGLRILRGIRFAAQLGFEIAPTTQAAILEKRHLLDVISKERIQTELRKTLCTTDCVPVLRQNAPVLFTILPELQPMEHFAQNTPYHCYDVWEHTLHAITHTPPDLTLRLTMLLHDSGKPAAYIENENGVGHFPGHAKGSVAIAKAILSRLRFDRKTTEQVCLLVQHHDLVLQAEEKWLKRQLNRFGAETFDQLLTIHRSDTLAQSAICQHRLQTIDDCARISREILRQQSCFQLRDLAVKGNDLLALGIPKGKQIGACLNQLLRAVMDGNCPNEREALLTLAKTEWI